MSLTGVCISKCSELPQLEQEYRVCYGVVLVTLDTVHYKSKVIVITSLLWCRFGHLRHNALQE